MENAAQQPDNDGGEDMVGLVPKPVPSKRQKKKLKQRQNLEKNKDKEIEKTVAYLTKWNLHRDEWKYEKLRQIFVQKNVFDAKVFDEEQSRVAIEYLATSKVFINYYLVFTTLLWIWVSGFRFWILERLTDFYFVRYFIGRRTRQHHQESRRDHRSSR